MIFRYGYIEFEDKDSVEDALALDGSILAGRQINVMKKRTNVPFKRKKRGGYRGRSRFPMIFIGGMGRGRGRRGYRPF